MDDPNRNELFIEPGTMTISLAENDFKHAKITGSFTQSQLDSVKAKKEIVFAKLGVRELQAKYETSLSALAKDKDNIQLRDQTRIAYGKLAPYREALRAIDFQFVAEHRNSYLSPYLLRFHLARLPLDSLEGFYSSLDAAIQNSFSGKLVKEQIMRKYGVGIGNSASNFTAKTSNGNFIELASFKSKKYVLLDFWASWCIPCRQHAPDLIMLFKKYHEQGLEIISISTDVNQQDWIQAIKNDKTGSWYHIQADLSEKKRSGEEVEHNRNSNLASKYVVGVLPTKMLISKDGTILVRDEGSDDKTLEQKLLEIFGF
jgi:thiol-disulfide isomerase/thioredoxin